MSDSDSSNDSSQDFKTCREFVTEGLIWGETSDPIDDQSRQDTGEKGLYTPPTSSGANVQVSGNAVYVSQPGMTYNIGRRANVHLHIGANITQQESESNPRRVSDLVQNMKRSNNAEYNMTEKVSRRACTPGTRVAQLEKLYRWSKGDPVMLYWLSGIAGTGKTTLSVSFSKMLDEENRLGANFFCSRSLPDCRDVKLIIPTVAYQLAMRYPVFEEALVSVLERDPDVYTRNLDGLLHKLIIKPWRSCSQNLPNDIVVVLDALDECERGHELFLNTIFENATNLPFKLLIASRPDFSIRKTMKTKGPETLSTFILHEVEKDLVEADIATYLDHCLSGRVPSDIIDEIKALSQSFFIVAATLAKLFIGGNFNARRRLELLKTSITTRNETLTPLDEVYRGVLHSAFHGADFELLDEEVEEIKDVLFLIVCARHPLTIVGLAGIFGISSIELTRRLDSLHSVLSVPDDPDRPVVIIHASFTDFMSDSSRSRQFCCYPDRFHLRITHLCLDVLNKELPQVIRKHERQLALHYAAEHWIGHLALSDGSLRKLIFKTIFDALAVYALHWIEFLGQLGQLPIVIQSLETLLNIVDEGAALAIVAQEYLYMVQHHYEMLYKDPTTIHHIITFIPLHSPLRSLHASLWSRSPKVLYGPGLPTGWPALERVINTHYRTVHSIAISQDGSRMVSGSRDKTVQILDMGKHTEERVVLTGHIGQVKSIAITQDGSRVVSGSDDKTVRIWDAATTKNIFTLKVPGCVWAVAISPDENYLASGATTGQIQVWDAVGGQLLYTLDGHTRLIRSLSFVPNSTDLVSGSDDWTARVWNALTGVTKSMLRGHTGWVISVACSPAGDRIATGSSDKSARVWNMYGQELQILQGHTNYVTAVAFMPDGKQVVTGSADRTLRFWDADTGHTLHVLTATDPIRSVAIFPGGLKIASSSGDQVDIWNMKSISSQVTTHKTPRVDAIRADTMVFSSDGQRVLLRQRLSWKVRDTMSLEERAILDSEGHGIQDATWSVSRRKIAISSSKIERNAGDKHRLTPFPGLGLYKPRPVGPEIMVWELSEDDVIVGKPLTLTGHTDEINHISFSHDDRHLCSASNDKTVGIWNIMTGEQVCALRHPDKVHGASFSHNDTQLVSNCEMTIHIWTIQTREQLYQINATNVYSCAFTPDDQHLITDNGEGWGWTITVWNARTGKKENEHRGYNRWATLKDGTSYALNDEGWVCQFARFGDTPRKLFWILPQNRPNIRMALNNPPFFLSSQGVQLCLPREDGLMIIIIPKILLG